MKMEKMVMASLKSEDPKKKLVEKLGLEPGNDGKYLEGFVLKVADDREITYDEARKVIIASEELLRVMFVLA